MEEKLTLNYFDKCMCCLETSGLREAWTHYNNDGEFELYGEMLNECFSLELKVPTDCVEQICEKCVQRLRDCLAFRREVLASREVLEQIKESIQELKEGELELEVEVKLEEKDADDRLKQEHDESSDVIMDEESQNVVDLRSGNEDDDDEDEDYNVEFLEEDADASAAIQKRKKATKYASGKYKQYSNADLEEALKKILDEEMTVAEASAKYNIPGRTLRLRIKKKTAEEKDTSNAEPKANPNADFYNEIRAVLTYTNATPYKTKVGRYHCAYCSTQGPHYLDMQELRTHTRTQHATERIKNIDMTMRPPHLNEVLKMDIYKLQCIVCSTDIPEWEMLFRHLKDKHDIELDIAYRKIIPYSLDKKLNCALCEESFTHYNYLDVHMNTHYNNYICGECGDTFLSETRMKKHMDVHSTGKYPCEICGKVFSLESYRKKHCDLVHYKNSKEAFRTYKCSHCTEEFTNAYNRHLHAEKQHPETIKTFVCEYCCMTFTWRAYYSKHIRLNHTTKFQCKLCSKRYATKHEIKNHLDWHKGLGYTCDACGKKFTSKPYLKKHNCKP